MLLAGEDQLGVRDPLAHECVAEHLGLRGRHNFALVPLQEQHRAAQLSPSTWLNGARSTYRSSISGNGPRSLVQPLVFS